MFRLQIEIIHFSEFCFNWYAFFRQVKLIKMDMWANGKSRPGISKLRYI